ncbi:MAG TPA: M14 family zinc carboxypeptidase [Armatimonadota bacterium]|nr:M14 family zinc carboxypeptidase [Armatimonadota bacterium]
MEIKVPQIAVPDFWLADLGKVHGYLRDRLPEGVVREFGRSSLDHPLHVVEYPREGAVKLMVIGGTHGHEPGTVASAMNLIHLRGEGRDLADQPHERLLELLDQVHLFVIPCLNPDGRSVCPDSSHCQALETCVLYASGLQKTGEIIPYDSDSDKPLYYFDPEHALFMGGQFNGAGWAMNRRLSDDESEAVEVQALLELVRELGLAAIIDLHACGYNFAFQVRSHEAPYWPVMREWQERAKALFDAKSRPLGRLHGDGDPPEPPAFFFNSALIHKHARLMWMAFEGRQGYLGRSTFMPVPTEWEIVDDYLMAVEAFVELGVEERYTAANREVFGD